MCLSGTPLCGLGGLTRFDRVRFNRVGKAHLPALLLGAISHLMATRFDRQHYREVFLLFNKTTLDDADNQYPFSLNYLSYPDDSLLVIQHILWDFDILIIKDSFDTTMDLLGF